MSTVVTGTRLVDDFAASAISRGAFAFDVEHPPDLAPHIEGFQLAGMSVATDDYTYYLQDRENWERLTHQLFHREDVEAIAYNGKYDLKCLVAAKVISPEQYPRNFVDPMIAVNLLDDNRRPNRLGLKLVVFDVFEHVMVDFKDAWAHGQFSQEFEDYAKEDAHWELRLWQFLKPKLEKENLYKLFNKILCPVSQVFADMEMTGLRWDRKGARKLLHGFQELRRQMEKEIREKVGNINLRSGDQLARVLFDDLGYSTRGIATTDSGKRFTVDAKAMNTLAKRYPVCEKIRLYRTADKMINTYVVPLTNMALADAHDRVHPTFWVVSTTGRTRSEKPNFQNIPAWLGEEFSELSIRKNFLATSGRKLLVADLSQIELRMVGHISGDPLFLQAYRAWQCTACGETGEHPIILHACPQCGCVEDERILNDSMLPGFWHGQDLHQQTADRVPALRGSRQDGKRSNFALVYYATASMMHYHYPNLSVGQWQDVIDEYFGPRAYAGVAKWHDKMRYQLDSHGVAVDVFGRRRRITREDVRRNYKHALNQLINFAPQASACELIELSLVKMRREFIERNAWLREVYPVNFVHDEIVLEVSDDYLDDAIPVVRDCMELSVKFTVPIRADIKIVDRWGDAK